MMALESLFIVDANSFKNSINTEIPQSSVYPTPKNPNISGERSEDRDGHIDNVGLDNPVETDTCDTCLGSGIVDEHQCPRCSGTGLIRNDQHQVEAAFESTKRSGDGEVINSTGADWSGMGQNEVPADYKASTLFVDMAPYRPTLERGREKYGTGIEENEQERIMNPGKVDEALWEKAKKASREALGMEKWPFIAYLYEKMGGKFA